MKGKRFEDFTREEQEWIDGLLNEDLAPEDFARLQDRMLGSRDLRVVIRRSVALRHDLEVMAESEEGVTGVWQQNEAVAPIIHSGNRPRPLGFFPLVMAASLAFVLGLALMYFGDLPYEDRPVAVNSREASAQGFAVIQKLHQPQWQDDSDEKKIGDSLSAESFVLSAGVAEIGFFSGATMVIQGPAEIHLKSAWEATCLKGSVRMRVPPAARGFKLHGPQTEIVDLGTEFGFRVQDGKGRVEVLDGEISLKHRNGESRLLEKGAAWNLPEDGEAVKAKAGEISFPELGGFDGEARAAIARDFEKWKSHRDVLAGDPGVIAYYTFDREDSGALISSLSQPRTRELDGAVILAEKATGRWPELKEALEFRRPGSRVRVRIPGEFEAFTFAAWVRIDSLDRQYNALFMGDGYETGEPHWQIRDDGLLMLSVMIDDSRPSVYPGDNAGFHRVYFSPPIWDQAMSGRWMHLVSVFDPAGRSVSHFVNGSEVSREEISDENLIETLRIGNGEIGNWGQPFRETPSFAIRNLNGRIDEFVIFKKALNRDEVGSLYEGSRSSVN